MGYVWRTTLQNPGLRGLPVELHHNRVQVPVDEEQDRIIERFDKYNLLTLPVIDRDGKLAGVITADDVISVLRHK